LTRQGAEFIDGNGGGPDVRLRKSTEAKPKKEVTGGRRRRACGCAKVQRRQTEKEVITVEPSRTSGVALAAQALTNSRSLYGFHKRWHEKLKCLRFENFSMLAG
jgi:hypothetical protein